MDNISGGMKSLCEDIVTTHEARKRSIKDLKEHVSSLREDFRKKEKEVRADLAEASSIWNKMNKTLETKKRGEIK